jgi:Double-stranded RNA binding motif
MLCYCTIYVVLFLLYTESHGTFKSQLLVYAQKKGKELPRYTSVSVGSPHALQFKATVVIDGLTFECPKFFRTLREAEHAAAKVALANLRNEESSDHNLQVCFIFFGLPKIYSNFVKVGLSI